MICGMSGFRSSRDDLDDACVVALDWTVRTLSQLGVCASTSEYISLQILHELYVRADAIYSLHDLLVFSWVLLHLVGGHRTGSA